MTSSSAAVFFFPQRFKDTHVNNADMSHYGADSVSTEFKAEGISTLVQQR